METTLIRAAVLSLIRHGLVTAGAGLIVEHNWADVESLVGAAIAIGSVAWSIWRSKSILKNSAQ